MKPIPNKEDLAGEALIYERSNGVVYARFRDKPKKEIFPTRWIIGGDPNAVAREQGYMGYEDWKRMFSLADEYPILRKQLDKVINLYYIIKDGDKK